MKTYQSTFQAMGGDNLLIVAAPDSTKAEAAMTAAAQEVIRIQDKYSRYRFDEGSLIHRINSSAGSKKWTECDEETLFLFNVAGQFHAESGGLFDVTSGVLRRVWDLKAQIVPSQAAVDAALQLIGWSKVEFDGARVRLSQPGMEIDFGGFGKEYAADRAGAILRHHGISSGLVNLGGDIHVAGPAPDGHGWLIGVENPLKDLEIASNITLSSGGLATSGEARKFFIKEGKRYSHILNPRTGFPAECWSSVSVLAANTLLAGFYSTTAMLLERSGESYLEGKKCRYLLIDRDGRKITDNKL